MLCGWRRDAVQRVISELVQRTGQGTFTESELRRAIDRWATPGADGDLPPFAGAIEAWLRKRLGGPRP
jgi:hypothetical protein